MQIIKATATKLIFKRTYVGNFDKFRSAQNIVKDKDDR